MNPIGSASTTLGAGRQPHQEPAIARSGTPKLGGDSFKATNASRAPVPVRDGASLSRDDIADFGKIQQAQLRIQWRREQQAGSDFGEDEFKAIVIGGFGMIFTWAAFAAIHPLVGLALGAATLLAAGKAGKLW